MPNEWYDEEKLQKVREKVDYLTACIDAFPVSIPEYEPLFYDEASLTWASQGATIGDLDPYPYSDPYDIQCVQLFEVASLAHLRNIIRRDLPFHSDLLLDLRMMFSMMRDETWKFSFSDLAWHWRYLLLQTMMLGQFCLKLLPPIAGDTAEDRVEELLLYRQLIAFLALGTEYRPRPRPAIALPPPTGSLPP